MASSTSSSAKKTSVSLFLALWFLVFTNVVLSCNDACKSPPMPPMATCPRDALKLGVCADVLGLVNVVVGEPPSGSKCCALLKGLVDLEAAACLCTAIKANVLGINLDVPVALSVLLSACQMTVPPGFTCP